MYAVLLAQHLDICRVIVIVDIPCKVCNVDFCYVAVFILFTDVKLLQKKTCC